MTFGRTVELHCLSRFRSSNKLLVLRLLGCWVQFPFCSLSPTFRCWRSSHHNLLSTKLLTTPKLIVHPLYEWETLNYVLSFLGHRCMNCCNDNAKAVWTSYQWDNRLKSVDGIFTWLHLNSHFIHFWSSSWNLLMGSCTCRMKMIWWSRLELPNWNWTLSLL